MTLAALPESGVDAQARCELAEEGKRLGKYLLGSEPTTAALEHYGAACLRVLGSQTLPEERAMLGFIERHPWSLPFLDAAAALLGPETLLRKKLFLMLSVLETQPAYVDVFTPRPRAKALVVVRLAGLACLSLLMLLLGAPLYGWSRRTR